MRSEDRAGIITVIMLFLWGTLIAEPFHIFVRYIAAAVTSVLRKLGAGEILTSVVLYLAVVAVIILMQKLSQTRLCSYLPCAISILFIVILVIRSLVKHTVDYGDAICLAIPAAVGIVFYLTRFEKGLLWFTSVYTYTPAVALLNALLFVPLSRLNGVLDKILYITNYNDLDITRSLGGLAGIPELVWGLFLTAFAVFPVIYLATSNRRK